MSEDHVVELVVYRAKEGVDPADLVGASQWLNDWVRDQPGFRSRDHYRSADDTWVDVLRWDTLEDALAAAAAAQQSERCGRFFGLLEEAGMTMVHGRQVAPTVTR